LLFVKGWSTVENSDATRESRPWLDRRCAMKISISQQLMDDLVQSVSEALATRGIVNIPQLAESIRKRYEGENIALEDIAELVMAQAQRFSAAMEFDRPALN
jgi:uncharacterized protein with von Willebrand factor type A (vWA) domain